MFYVYLIKSKKDGELYTGFTNDLKRRLLEHNQGLNESTKYRGPFELIYYEAYKSEEDARAREHNLKLRANALGQLIRCGGQAEVAKLGNAQALGVCESNLLWVRIPPSAQSYIQTLLLKINRQT